MDGCQHCGAADVAEDYWLGSAVCQACGYVAEDSMLQDSLAFDNGQLQGTIVRNADVEAGYWFARGSEDQEGGGWGGGERRAQELAHHRAMAQVQALAQLRRVCAVLRLSKEHEQAAQGILEEALAGLWGTGAWVEVLIAACVYVAVRRARLPLSMVEVADAGGVPPPSTWVVYHRVLSVLIDRSVPPLDPNLFVRRAVMATPALADWREGEGQGQLMREALAVLRFGMAQSLQTGRHPLALAAASVLVVASAHNIPVQEEQVCGAIHAVLSTARRRVKELWASLLEHVKKLPWGGGVEEASLAPHLPFLLRVLVACGGAPAGTATQLAPSFEAAVSQAASRKERLQAARERLKHTKKRWKEGQEEGGSASGAKVGAETGAVEGGSSSGSKKRGGDTGAVEGGSTSGSRKRGAETGFVEGRSNRGRKPRGSISVSQSSGAAVSGVTLSVTSDLQTPGAHRRLVSNKEPAQADGMARRLLPCLGAAREGSSASAPSLGADAEETARASGAPAATGAPGAPVAIEGPRSPCCPTGPTGGHVLETQVQRAGAMPPGGETPVDLRSEQGAPGAQGGAWLPQDRDRGAGQSPPSSTVPDHGAGGGGGRAREAEGGGGSAIEAEGSGERVIEAEEKRGRAREAEGSGGLAIERGEDVTASQDDDDVDDGDDVELRDVEACSSGVLADDAVAALEAQDLQMEWLILRKAPAHVLEGGWYGEQEARSAQEDRKLLRRIRRK